MERPFYSSKKFLNQEGYNSDASIFCDIVFYSETNSGCDATLKIRDCSQSVHISVGIEERGNTEYYNSVFKLNVLIDELTKFRDALIEAEKESSRREELERQAKQTEDENNSGINSDLTLRSDGITTPTTTS